MNNLESLLTKRPPELMKAANLLVQSHSVSTEVALSIIQKEFMPMLTAVYTKLDEVQKELSSSGKVSENKLATYFLSNPTSLEGFAVVKDTDTLNYKVTYLGKDDKISITDGYNKVMKELIRVFGFKDLSFHTLSNAIIRAYCWFQEGNNSPNEVLQLTSESCLLEVASSFSKQFTIPEIKQKLPELDLPTKQIERVLLLNNFGFKQYGTSRKKYFYPNPKTSVT
jgi:hypothetical protein